MLTHDQLFSLEQYARLRPAFRAKVMAHKKNRQVAVGPNATLYFEDQLTMQDRKSTRLNSSHSDRSRMPSSA